MRHPLFQKWLLLPLLLFSWTSRLEAVSVLPVESTVSQIVLESTYCLAKRYDASQVYPDLIRGRIFVCDSQGKPLAFHPFSVTAQPWGFPCSSNTNPFWVSHSDINSPYHPKCLWGKVVFITDEKGQAEITYKRSFLPEYVRPVVILHSTENPLFPSAFHRANPLCFVRHIKDHIGWLTHTTKIKGPLITCGKPSINSKSLKGRSSLCWSAIGSGIKSVCSQVTYCPSPHDTAPLFMQKPSGTTFSGEEILQSLEEHRCFHALLSSEQKKDYAPAASYFPDLVAYMRSIHYPIQAKCCWAASAIHSIEQTLVLRNANLIAPRNSMDLARMAYNLWHIRIYQKLQLLTERIYPQDLAFLISFHLPSGTEQNPAGLYQNILRWLRNKSQEPGTPREPLDKFLNTLWHRKLGNHRKVVPNWPNDYVKALALPLENCACDTAKSCEVCQRCPICLDPLFPPRSEAMCCEPCEKSPIALDCQHKFHLDCINDYYLSDGFAHTCPICKATFKPFS
jgi:hypothetical protein